jgi:PAS domain S-box-containing protein
MNVGLSEKEILGKTDRQIFPAERAAQFHQIDQTLLQTRQAYEFEDVSSRSDGIHTEIVFKFLVTTPQGKPYALCGIARDITQRKQAETILQEASQRLEIQKLELRSLASQLLMAQEEERRRISRDLHDDVNQRLALLSLKLQTAQKGLPDIHPVTLMLQELYESVADLSDDIRHLAYQYHPSILDDLGLGTALRSLCEDFAKWEGVSVTWELTDGARNFSQAVATCLYRVAQESLRNVSRHAQASAVHLVLREDGQGISLSIRDNGQGFEVDGLLSRGLGLVSMRERACLVGGTLCVDSQPGQGTIVKVSIPGSTHT